MLKELFESVVSQAHKSVEPEQPRLIPEITAKDGRVVAYVYKGEIVERQVAAPPRKHRAMNAASFVQIIETCCTVKTPMLFVTGDRVSVVLDDDRRERATLSLPPSQHIQALQLLPKQMNQRDSISYLRKALHGTGFEDYSVALREVVFDRSQRTAGQLNREQESMGRSVEARVSGTKDLPELLHGRVLIFDPSVFRATDSLELGCDAKLLEEVFEFWLPPNALEEAISAGVAQLIEYLQKSIPNAVIVQGEE